MLAISIRQPWAWLIVRGFKPLENRSRSTKLRGDFLDHGYVLADAVELPFVPCKGQLGFFQLPADVIAKAGVAA
jgi:hypothetical protein